MAFHHHLTSSFHFVSPVRNICHFEEFYTYYKHFYTNKDDGIRSMNTFVPLNVYLVFNDIYIYLHSFEYRPQFTIHFLKEINLYHIYNMICRYIHILYHIQELIFEAIHSKVCNRSPHSLLK